jgi:methionyl-tRNA formyltransferase
MKIIFAGTPEFAAVALTRLLAAGFTVPLVLTQPDRPAGRGMRLVESAVKKVALESAIEVLQPQSLRRDPAAVEKLRAVPHDVMVVAAYGLILPQEVLDIPPQGCLNIHASLRPRWRGAAPVQRAIAAGDRETGVCIMRMEAGLDTGPVLARRTIPIGANDTARTLTAALATLGGELIVEALHDLASLAPRPQPQDGVTYAAKIEKAEAPLDFRMPADVLARKVRAFDPFPGASATSAGQILKVWDAMPGPHCGERPAGEIVTVEEWGIGVACGDGTSLVLVELQRAGGKRLPARQFLQGFPLAPGERFELET